jgi:integrase/recombinase XerD
MKDFEEYLQSKKLRPTTIYNQLIYVRRFVEWLSQEGITPQTCKYSDLLAYVKKYRQEGFSSGNLNSHLQGIRHYYRYKTEKGELTYNPAFNLMVRGQYTTLPKEILTRHQTEKVYNEYQANTPVQKRNKVILGFYVYQGLMRQEIERLEPSDINLKKGTVLIRKNVRLSQRLLPLDASQVLQLQEYLDKVRPELIRLKGRQSDKLFLTIGDSHLVKDAVKELLNELQHKYKFLNSFQQVRNSVIYQWVKEKNIREAQYMAGHASIHSTQRYKQVSMDDLQLQLELFHPLK